MKPLRLFIKRVYGLEDSELDEAKRRLERLVLESSTVEEVLRRLAEEPVSCRMKQAMLLAFITVVSAVSDAMREAEEAAERTRNMYL